MISKRTRRIAAAVLAALLILAAFAIQLFGGRGVLPTWQQLRAALGVPLQTEESAPLPSQEDTAVYLLDVGQGDAVLLCQNGAYCLIDTGPADAEEALLYDLDRLDVTALDYLVLTHPHSDHTGNACAVLRQVTVRQLLLPNWQPGPEDTADWPRRLAQLASDCGTEMTTAEPGDSYPLGNGTLQILQGGSDGADSVNDVSLCTMFTTGAFRFLDTGDAEEAAEQRLLDTYGPTLHATLFKAGHHGSYTSNSLAFLQAVQPQAVAVSCGLNNDYGHPHRAALQNFAAVDADVYRTDLQGSLTFTWRDNTLCVETAADSADSAA